MRHRIGRLIAFLGCCVLAACSQPGGTPTVELQGMTMGTSYSVTLYKPARALKLTELRTQIRRRLDDIESIASTYDPAAELATLNSSPSTDWQTVSNELCQLLDTALQISERTNGAFDVTVGAAVNAWGFGPDASASQVPAKQQLLRLQKSIGFRHFASDCDKGAVKKSNPNTLLDLSAFAKGYAIDEVAKLLNALNVEHFLVEIGGEVRGGGTNARGNAFAIGIESPNPGGLSGQYSIRLVDAAIATSGDYRNFTVIEGTRYSHAIDPRTATPVTHTLAAVSVVDISAATADALATALLVMGPDNGVRFAIQHELAALFVIRDGDEFRSLSTPDFEALVIRD